jgi:hypothetical protein
MPREGRRDELSSGKECLGKGTKPFRGSQRNTAYMPNKLLMTNTTLDYTARPSNGEANFILIPASLAARLWPGVAGSPEKLEEKLREFLLGAPSDAE